MSREARSPAVARGTSNLTPVSPKHLGRYLAEGEVLYVETRATKLFYFPGPVLVLVIMLILDYSCAAAFYGWTRFPGLSALFAMVPHSPSIYRMIVLDILLLITLIVLIWLLIQYVRWVRTVYAVSNHRVIIKRGIASRDVDDIPMTQVRGVDVHQSFGQRILGYGTIRVSAEPGTAKSIGNEDWLGIPKPFQVQRTIETVMQNPGMTTSPFVQPTTVIVQNVPGSPPR